MQIQNNKKMISGSGGADPGAMVALAMDSPGLHV